MATKRLGDILLAAGAISEEQLGQALALQKKSKQRLGEVLISNDIISEDELIDALQMQLGIEYIDLTKYAIPAEMAHTVPKNIAKQYSIIPVKLVRDELYLAMSDPLNFYAIEEARKAVRKKIVPMIARKSSIVYAIQILYGNEGAARAIEDMKREVAGNGESISVQDSSFVSNQLGDDAGNAPSIRLVNSIIERAITERASDIHIEPREEQLYIRMRIDGVMREILTVPKNLQNPVITRWKVMSGMNTAERRVPQDGRFNVKVRERDFDLRVSTLPTVYGEKIVARLLDKSGGSLSREAIGLAGDDLKKYERMLHSIHGVVLIAGPTGSGKTTTMYTMINDINKPDVNLTTLEDPVEYNIDGANQVQIFEKVGMTFAEGLRAVLRQDPDIIAVGEIRDGETADIAVRAAITGHMVLSTIHTNSALGTIERLLDIGVEPYLIASALKGVISQRLVRRICPYCKTSYEVDRDEAEELGLVYQPGLIFHRGKGCPNCFDTGYRGRIAVFEMLNMNKELRKMIVSKSTVDDMEALLMHKESGFVSIQENARRLVMEGITTSEEVMRVIYGGEY